jgi:glycerophosphoryl diester phosphodiesterase
VAPENTTVAFRMALDAGAAGVELDVRLSRDGVPVVIHDASLRRTAQLEEIVAAKTSGDLQLVDVGSGFNRAHPELARDEYRTQTVPTLAQVFELFSQRPNLSKIVYVEMKNDQADETYVDLARAVAQTIKANRMHARVVVVSFNLRAVAEIKSIDSSITTGALFEPRRNPVKLMRGHPLISAALACGAEEILFHRFIATRGLVDLARENNLRSVVWTVDDPQWLRRRSDRVIHAVITNKPGEVLASL